MRKFLLYLREDVTKILKNMNFNILEFFFCVLEVSSPYKVRIFLLKKDYIYIYRR